MEKLLRVLGVLCFIAAIGLAIYVGGYLLLAGGIIDIVKGAKANPINEGVIVLGALKSAVLAGLSSIVIVVVLGCAGMACLGSGGIGRQT